jgi:hypothetical protein
MKAIRHASLVALLAGCFVVLPGAAPASGYADFFCRGYLGNPNQLPAHTYCPERVVGRFTEDLAYSDSSRSGVWAKVYLLRPFGLPRAVLEHTYYNSTFDGGARANYILNGLDSNRVVCGAIANVSDYPLSTIGYWSNGLVRPYALPCDQAVSKFTGLPVYH